MRTPLLLFAFLLMAACTATGPQAVREPLHRPATVTMVSTGMDVDMAPEREVVTEAMVASPDAAWAALQGAYGEFDIPVEEMNADLRILGNPRLVVSRRLAGHRLSRYLDCGYGPAGNHADTHRVELQIRSSILEVTGGVRVNTHLAAIARSMDGTSNTRVRCASTFRLEQEISGRVKFWAEAK